MGRLALQVGSNAYAFPELEEKVSPLHGVAFGTTMIGIAVGEDSTLLRTKDGGKTWDLLTNLPKDFRAGTHFYAITVNPFDTDRYLVVGANGIVLGSADDGDNWSLLKTGVTEDLHGIVRAGEDRHFIVGDEGRVLVGNALGSTWSPEDPGTTESFRAISAISAIESGTTQVGPQVWAVTEDGSIYYRSPTALSGLIAVVEAEDLTVRAATGQRLVREILISNKGTEPLTIETVVSGDEGIEVQPKGTQTLQPGEQATVHVVITVKTDGALNGSISFVSSDNALGKESLDIFIEVRDPHFLPLGYAVLSARLDLGVVPVVRRHASCSR